MATPAPALDVAAKLIEVKLRRIAISAVERMDGFLRVTAEMDLNAAGRGVWPGPYEGRQASNVWGSGP